MAKRNKAATASITAPQEAPQTESTTVRKSERMERSAKRVAATEPTPEELERRLKRYNALVREAGPDSPIYNEGLQFTSLRLPPPSEPVESAPKKPR